MERNRVIVSSRFGNYIYNIHFFNLKGSKTTKPIELFILEKHCFGLLILKFSLSSSLFSLMISSRSKIEPLDVRGSGIVCENTSLFKDTYY